MDQTAHWEQVYRTKGPDQVSWFQAEARLSMQLIERIAPDRGAHILDVGAGASRLVDGLLARGYRELMVIDLASAALAISQHRLGAAASLVTWRSADILSAPLARSGFDVWHDRAVFHFLTDPLDRARYVAKVRQAM